MAYEKNVLKHLQHCSKLVGDNAATAFDQDTFCEFSDLRVESPIEQLLYVSLKTVAELCYIPHHDIAKIDGHDYVYGLNIQPQHPIKTYRIDFYVSWSGYISSPLKQSKHVAVECDSQQWHERTEKERRYEKKRDRELANSGIHTFRFTGKEIIEDPFKPACEVIAFLSNHRYEDLYESLAGFQ